MQMRQGLAWLCLLVGISGGCGTGPSASPPPAASEKAPTQNVKPSNRPSSIAESFQSGSPKFSSNRQTTSVRLVNRASELGIEQIYQNGASGNRLMVEATGGGCGWVDFDRDGWWDLYVAQGGNPAEPAGPGQPMDRL